MTRAGLDRRLLGSPVVQTLGLVVAVFAVQTVLGALGRAGLFALSGPVLADRPWTLATSVYAHATPGHLLANALGIALLGPLVARRTTTPRFHAFFLATGALSGATQVAVSGLLGPSPAVLGASGAVFGLAGYMLSGNTVTGRLLDRLTLSRRAQAVLLVAVVATVTLVTGGSPSRVALVAHATGLLVGLVAGRVRLLDSRPARGAVDAQSG